jgi:hypothetical protein
MAIIKIKGKPNIYLNSLIENASSYFSEQTQPIKVTIIDAYFEQNKITQIGMIEGLYDYIRNRNNLNLNDHDKEFVHNMYSNLALCLLIKEEVKIDDTIKGKYETIKLDNLDEIADHLAENATLDKEKIANELKINSTTKLGKEALKIEMDERQRIANEKRDSCTPFINRSIYIYRQSVNGRDIIAFSKYYKPTQVTTPN